MLNETIVQLVCFKLGGEEYAFDIMDIQEVVRVQEMTHIQQLPDFVLGVLNLRGNIISVFDLRKKLHLPVKPYDNNTKIVVAKVDESIFSMVIDEILENVTMERSGIDPAPNVKMKISRDCIAGLGALEGRIITILDLGRIHDEIKKELGI
ncbi:MAG: purine-binding chemotaxis protein CheW [Candidatus Omnitrophica bacterium]|nr:purine-binding chemotaxis protein CheW [Candidatus Omnitrophota bacterium]